MGCCTSRTGGFQSGRADGGGRDRGSQGFKPPRWKSTDPITESELKRKREEFWDTAPHYGGDRVIWDALKATCEAPDPETARLIIESAGIIVGKADGTVSYDERGAKYELPKYVLSAPTNLLKDSPDALTAPGDVEMQTQR